MAIKTRRKYKKRHLKTRKGGFSNSKKRFIKLVLLNKNKGLRKTKHLKFNKKNINLKRRSRIAGEVIGKGGFGCVFKPALVCEGENGDQFSKDSKYVSKVMTNVEANKELDEIKAISEDIYNIDPSQNYFIIPNKDDLCKINIKNEKNLEDLNKARRRICTDIFKDYSDDDFDTHIGNDFEALNMRDGGNDLEKWLVKKTGGRGDSFGKRKLSTLDFNNINTLLIKLLENAIIPMNQKNILHLDIKMLNILYDGSNLRLIDFGFARKFDSIKIPSMHSPGRLYYGAPFGNLLFNKDGGKINDILKKIHDSATMNMKMDINDPDNYQNVDIKLFLQEILGLNHKDAFAYFYWLNKYCKSNFSNMTLRIPRNVELKEYVLDSIFVILNKYSSTAAAEKEAVDKAAADKAAADKARSSITSSTRNVPPPPPDIYIKFLKESSLQYFNDVFSKNADIFAFLLMYINLYDLVEDENIKANIKNLIFDYILSSEFAVTPYDHEKLVRVLRGLAS